MRKNKSGRPSKIKGVQMLVAILRERKDMSYTEIAKELNLGSKQLARYHYLRWLKLRAEANL